MGSRTMRNRPYPLWLAPGAPGPDMRALSSTKDRIPRSTVSREKNFSYEKEFYIAYPREHVSNNKLARTTLGTGRLLSGRSSSSLHEFSSPPRSSALRRWSRRRASYFSKKWPFGTQGPPSAAPARTKKYSPAANAPRKQHDAAHVSRAYSRDIESVTRRVGRWGFSKVYPWNGRIQP